MERFFVKMKLGDELQRQAPAYSPEAMANQRAAADTEEISEQFANQKEQENRKRKRLENELKRQEEEAKRRAREEELRIKASQPIPRKDDGSLDQPMHTIPPQPTRMLYVEDVVSGVWPKQTDELCRWDLQPFTGTPIGIPRAFDKREHKFHLEGYFCSFSCAMAYVNMHSKSFDTFKTGEHLVQFARDFYGDYFHHNKINPAPPRAKLSFLYAKFVQEKNPDPMKAAVAEFRADSEKMLYHPQPTPPFLRVTQAIDEQEIVQRQEQQHQDRLELMTQAPRPIALTQRGMTEQRKYVLARRKKTRKTGAIGQLLGIKYTSKDDDDDN